MEQLGFDGYGLPAKIESAIDTLQTAAEMSAEFYGQPLIVCYSGGKDSDVLLDLAKKADIDFEVLHSLTTVDAPPTVRHIKKVFAELEEQGITATIRKPTYKGQPATMWRLIEDKTLPPTRLMRYCCAVLKETGTPNRLAALGVRRDESTRRAVRQQFEVRAPQTEKSKRYTTEHVKEQIEISKEYGEAFDCIIIQKAREHKDVVCNPIIEWTDADVWEYVEQNNIELNPMYFMGYSRVGCVGCPMGGGEQMKRGFNDFPAYKLNYIKAFDRAVKKRKEQGKPTKWETGTDVFNWWVGDDQKETVELEGQLTL